MKPGYANPGYKKAHNTIRTCDTYPNLNINVNVKYGWFILEATLA